MFGLVRMTSAAAALCRDVVGTNASPAAAVRRSDDRMARNQAAISSPSWT
jgi:hypothetical protein